MILLDSRDQIFSYLYDLINKQEIDVYVKIKMERYRKTTRNKFDGIQLIKNINKHHQEHFQSNNKNKSRFQRAKVSIII